MKKAGRKFLDGVLKVQSKIEQIGQQSIERFAHWMWEVMNCLRTYYSLVLVIWFLMIVCIGVWANYIKG